jgi:hypothetical protein
MVTGANTWRTPTAIGLAAAIGVPIGLFLYATAVPFGPILLGWFVALAGAVVVTACLCILATHRFVTVGVGYAAGVAAATVVAGLVMPRSGPDVGGLLYHVGRLVAQFGVSFTILAAASLPASGLCALLKWEDRRARQKSCEQ